MKTQYCLVLLALMASLALIAAVCDSFTLVPRKIEEQASWITVNDPQWNLRWKDSPRDQNPRTFRDSTIEMDVTSRATVWFNQSQETGLLLLSTPDIYVLGFAQNPFKTNNDEWVIREIARQGGGAARQELGITFDPVTVPLTFQESVSAQTSFGINMNGSRFLAQTPKGDGYATILRGVHEKDVLVLVTVSQSLSANRASANIASSLHHPSAEPPIKTFVVLTCRVFATREGLIGHTTANGHVIGANDRFAALPSRAVLASRGDYEYTVRITHNNRSVVVPIWDVGPWNTRDNYWDAPAQRQQWQDLPQCLPQAQAAYINGYNSGKDQFDRQVTNPAGIDLSEGVWVELNMKDNAWVTVEFLWTAR